MDQVLNTLLTSATKHRDAATSEGLKLFYEGMCQAYMSLHMLVLAGAVAQEIEAKKSLLEENKRLTNELKDAKLENDAAGDTIKQLRAFKDASTEPVTRPKFRPIVPEVEDRKTFTVPPGFEAERDEDGYATGRVVPATEQLD